MKISVIGIGAVGAETVFTHDDDLQCNRSHYVGVILAEDFGRGRLI
jgi:hypothetical protein